jgi:hypothetical protein
MASRKLSLARVRALPPSTTIWDGAIPGFVARRQKSKAVVYVLKYRTAGSRQRWYTIGRHGAPWTPDTARAEALRLLGEIVRRTDPSADKQAWRQAGTVSDLCDQYFAHAEAGRLPSRKGPRKPASLAIDRHRAEAHIKPLLGRHAATAITREDV